MSKIDTQDANAVTWGKQPRGFAKMSPERHREIASMGGKTAHATGKAHKFTSEQAREAGRKGGLAKRKPKAES